MSERRAHVHGQVLSCEHGYFYALYGFSRLMLLARVFHLCVCGRHACYLGCAHDHHVSLRENHDVSLRGGLRFW